MFDAAHFNHHTLLGVQLCMTRAENEGKREVSTICLLIQNRWALIANHDGENKSLDEMLNSKKSHAYNMINISKTKQEVLYILMNTQKL